MYIFYSFIVEPPIPKVQRSGIGKLNPAAAGRGGGYNTTQLALGFIPVINNQPHNNCVK